jgi:predicted PurR-regulated permease PerM
MQAPARVDLTRIFLTLLIIAALIVGSLWTILPFLGAVIWAATIVVATWPLMLWVERRVGGHRSVATAVMTIVMLLIFVLPFALAVGALFEAATQGAEFVKGVITQGLPPPPAWLTGIPLLGPKLAAKWQALAAAGPDVAAETLRPYVRSIASVALSLTGGIGGIALHFLLTVIIAAVLYANGETAAKGLVAFARRINREHGEGTIRLAGQAVRGVALGVVVTALVEALIAALGLWLAGVPHPGVLVALVFIFGVAQLGPLPVMLPIVIWVFWSGSIGWGIGLSVVTVLVVLVDNVLKPVLIQRGIENLPLLVIVAGVIGGMVSFGVVGLFIGPVILAVTYTLLIAWIDAEPAASA